MMVAKRVRLSVGGGLLVAVGALLAGCTDDYAQRSLEEARDVAEEQGREVVIVLTPRGSPRSQASTVRC